AGPTCSTARSSAPPWLALRSVDGGGLSGCHPADDRQAGRPPGLKPAVEIGRPREPESLQRDRGEARLVTAIAHQDHEVFEARSAGGSVPAVRVKSPLEHVARY